MGVVDNVVAMIELADLVVVVMEVADVMVVAVVDVEEEVVVED